MGGADDRLTGSRIADRYRLVRVLGRGGMATVFEAIDERDGRPVAVKVVRRSTDRVDRFERELLATRRIAGPFVCELLDAGTLADGRPYLVMPLLVGMSLRKLLEQAAPLPVPLALSIADQVLGALEAAHLAGVVHRDLKPENVFLLDDPGKSPTGDDPGKSPTGDDPGKSPTGDDPGPSAHFVKVLDFGIARLTDGGAYGVATATGQAIGTPNYMAPEQARGQRDQDERVDVWAAGILLYEMTTGTRPFEGGSYGETLARLLFDPFPAPSVRQPGLSPRLEDVILRALQRDRDERFPSAQAMREALSVLQEGPPCAPPRVTPVTVVPGDAMDGEESTIVEPPRDDRDTDPR